LVSVSPVGKARLHTAPMTRYNWLTFLFLLDIFLLLISAPSQGVCYCQQVTLSVCVSVCLAPSNCFFFVSRWNRAIFWPSVLHVPLYKTFFFDFSFRPLMPKICPPKFAKNRLQVDLYGRYTGDVWAYHGVFGDG